MDSRPRRAGQPLDGLLTAKVTRGSLGIDVQAPSWHPCFSSVDAKAAGQCPAAAYHLNPRQLERKVVVSLFQSSGEILEIRTGSRPRRGLRSRGRRRPASSAALAIEIA